MRGSVLPTDDVVVDKRNNNGALRGAQDGAVSLFAVTSRAWIEFIMVSSSPSFFGLAASVLAGLALAQTPPSAPDPHPLLPTWKCTNSGGCVQQNTSVVLDFEYRNVHVVGGTTSCLTGNFGMKLDPARCPNNETC